METNFADARLLSAGQAAALIGVTRQRLAQLVAAGEVPFVARTRAGRVYSADDIRDFVERRRRSGRRVKIPA